MSVTLSVVIPVYNGAAFIASTIQAALAQTFRDFEIVVVNDGSRDATAACLAQFGDAIKVISIPNGGVSNARNVGIRASSGQFIAFLDADDLWHPQKNELQIATMLRHPSVGFCCCNYSAVNPVNNTIVSQFDQFRNDHNFILDAQLADPLALLIKYNFVGTCSNVIIRRDVLERVGLFNPSYRQAEDYDLWLRCSAETGFILMSDVLLEKKRHTTNLTNNFLETLHYHDMVLNAIRDSHIITERPYLIPEIRHAIATARYSIGNRWFNRGEAARGYSFFWLALKEDLSFVNFLCFLGQAGKKTARLLLETLRLRAPIRD